MKNLILICGANGIGKSAACRELTEMLPDTAFIDSDYCRYMNPFSFSEEEIGIVISNISNMMINYFKCTTINNVIFQYGFHGVRKRIFDAIIEAVQSHEIVYRFCPIVLQCDLSEHLRRMKNDGRDEERMQRAIENTRAIYDQYNYPRIDTTALSPNETAKAIIDIFKNFYYIL